MCGTALALQVRRPLPTTTRQLRPFYLQNTDRSPAHTVHSNTGSDIAVTNFQARQGTRLRTVALHTSCGPPPACRALAAVWAALGFSASLLTPHRCLYMQVESPDASDEVLDCPTLRGQLRPRPSPFVVSALAYSSHTACVQPAYSLHTACIQLANSFLARV